MSKATHERINTVLAKLQEKGMVKEFVEFKKGKKVEDMAKAYMAVLADEMIEMEDLPNAIYNFTEEMQKAAGTPAAVEKEAPMKQQIAVRETAGLPVMSLFEEEAGHGFENTDTQDYAVPILRILHSSAPECNKAKDKYIEGAEYGKILNIATQDLYDDIIVVPCFYKKSDVEWVPRETSGSGGFVGEHEVSKIWNPPLETNEKGRRVNDRGNEIIRTSYFFCLFVHPNGQLDNVVIPMSSTQLTCSKKWMSMMAKIQFEGKNGFYQAPMFSHYYKLGTEDQSNSKGDWKGWTVNKAGIIEDPNVYTEAKLFRDLAKAGNLKVEQDQHEDASEDGDF